MEHRMEITVKQIFNSILRQMLLVKIIQIGKVTLSLFADDMILYIEDPKDVIRKLPSELSALE